MSKTYLFDRVSDLKEKFKNFFIHKKKLQALENYSSVVNFKHKDYLILIKKCMADGFLGEEEATFLSHMVDKYFDEQHFLDWTHKTKWLKSEINRLTSNYHKPIEQASLFDWSQSRNQTSHVPFELLAQQQKHQPIRRV